MGSLQENGEGSGKNLVVRRREDQSGKGAVKNSEEEGKEQSCDQMNSVLNSRVEEHEPRQG